MIATAETAGATWRLVYAGRHRASTAFLDELARYGDRVSVRPWDETGLLDSTRCSTPRSRTPLCTAAAPNPCSPRWSSAARSGRPARSGIGVPSSCAEAPAAPARPVLGGQPDHRDSVLTDDAKLRNDCVLICISRSCTHASSSTFDRGAPER